MKRAKPGNAGESNRALPFHTTYDAFGKLVAEYSTQVATQQNATVSYLTSDNLGSPRINTDQNGVVTARHDYQPFGEEIQRASYGADDVRKQFTSYERDDETNLDFAQARYYANNLGRFNSPDPILVQINRLIEPQAINLYIYVKNNPMIYIDPNGEEYIGADDERVEYEKKDGKIVVKSGKETKDLERLRNLINEKGSKTAIAEFMKGNSSKTKVYVVIDTENSPGKFSLNQPHGERLDGSKGPLKYDPATNSFEGKIAYRKENGKELDEYEATTVTIFEKDLANQLPSQKSSAGYNFPEMTVDDFIVSSFSHEIEHGLDKDQIKARRAGNLDYDLEKKPREKADKTIEEIKKNRSKSQ